MERRYHSGPFKTDQPIKVKEIDEVGLSNRVAISIWKNSQVLGFIWALEIKKLNDEDLKTLQLAAKAVRNKLLHLQIRKTKIEERGQEFLENADRPYLSGSRNGRRVS